MRADKLAFAVAEYDVTELVRERVDEQRRMHPGRRIDLRIALPAERARVTVRVDADRIGQVLDNYLSNALKYSPDEAPVVVTLAVQDDADSSGIPWTRVAVKDAGPGLAPEAQRQIWERFYRVPGVEVQSGSGIGLGLGLYISREIIARHGGRVGVDSVLGQGATFWFDLPLTLPPVN
jgi:signal transduction histidine kinase